MATIKRFEDLEIWQLARELLKLIYDDFRDCKDSTFRNQIIAAGLSIMNNIAEDQKYVTSPTAIDRRERADLLLSKITNFMFYLKR